MQVSQTPCRSFEWSDALPGVGEAPKREIAGLGLADQIWLWVFEGAITPYPAAFGRFVVAGESMAVIGRGGFFAILRCVRLISES